MRAILVTVHCLLITSFLFLSCAPITQTPQPQRSLQTSFYIYRFNPPAFIEFSEDFQRKKEIPFSIPPNCGLFNIFPAPIGKFMAIELNCPNGQTVLYFDVESASVDQPVTDSDSHFLAWTPAGDATYLKIDSLGNARVIRANTNGKKQEIDISPWTYDLSTQPNGSDFTFTFSRGLGYGSELHLAQNADDIQPLYADPYNYISFARWSPDGSQIAFIKIPDSPTPFTVGELWAMNKDGSNARKLADADAGHGYAANWSPDGRKIAFVVRENPEDERANQSRESLISNIYVIDVTSGELTHLTHLTKGHVETPSWSPHGNTLAFNAVVDGRIEVRIADITTGEIRSLITESTCCPAWMRK
jgi:dipeptidyl aminopeptidase/acylaminoacyl peptidase